LKSLLKKAGAPEPYILVGEEYGSLVTTNFVNLYPNAVSGVVLINPICEEKIKTPEFKQNIKGEYYRLEIEKIGSNFSLTALLSKMGLTMENNIFKSYLTENELAEFNNFKNNNKYKKAVFNEYQNLYLGKTDSQRSGLLDNTPFYLITDNEEDSIKEIGDAPFETIYKVENDDVPFSLIDPDTVVNGVNSVIKDAKKLDKKS
jgi:pimeloyl-ACP methyl ester carboxylesterase